MSQEINRRLTAPQKIVDNSPFYFLENISPQTLERFLKGYETSEAKHSHKGFPKSRPNALHNRLDNSQNQLQVVEFQIGFSLSDGKLQFEIHANNDLLHQVEFLLGQHIQGGNAKIQIPIEKLRP